MTTIELLRTAFSPHYLVKKYVEKPPCPVFWGTALLINELAREQTYGDLTV